MHAVKVQISTTLSTTRLPVLIYDAQRRFMSTIDYGHPAHAKLVDAVRSVGSLGGFKAYFNAWRSKTTPTEVFAPCMTCFYHWPMHARGGGVTAWLAAWQLLGVRIGGGGWGPFWHACGWAVL